MQESEFKAALLTRRAKLAEQIKALTRELKACDTMLAGLEEDPPTAPAAAPPGPIPVEAGPALTPAPGSAPLPDVEPSASSPAPAIPEPPPPPPKIGPTPEELSQLAELAKSDRRGSQRARAELAIARCGDTFTLRDVMDVLKRDFHWRGHDDQMASAFWKAVHYRGYVLVKAGRGRSPAIYGKTPPPVAVPT